METFRQRGGARIGGKSRIARFNLTWPFVTLTADAHKIRLGGFLCYELPKSRLVRLSAYSGALNRGLRMEHTVPEVPAFIVFWTFDYERLAANLRHIGYVVD